MFLKKFLKTAEDHFFVGFKVHVYVFTDRPKEVPQVEMAAGRKVDRINRLILNKAATYLFKSLIICWTFDLWLINLISL